MTNKEVLFLKKCISMWGNIGAFKDWDNNSFQKLIDLARKAIRSQLNGELIDGLSLDDIKTLIYVEGFCNYLIGYNIARRVYFK